jgi:hypothetical protein
MCFGIACSVTVRLQWLHLSILGVSTIGRPVAKAFVMSEGGRLTSDGFSFFFSTTACQNEGDPVDATDSTHTISTLRIPVAQLLNHR